MLSQIRFSMVRRVLTLVGVALFAACGSTAPYYKDSVGRIREPKPEDPRLPYAVQQGEFLKDENLWPYATRGPMKFLGEYQFSHKWFVVRGFCDYGGMTGNSSIVSPDGAGRGRGFIPRSFTEEGVKYGDITKRGNLLFKQFRRRDDGSIHEGGLPARIGPGPHDGYLSSVCKLHADSQLGRYSGEATGAALSITDQSFDTQSAASKLGYCSRIANDPAYSRNLSVEHRPSGKWQTCVVEKHVQSQLANHWEMWTMALADTGYYLEVIWSLSRPVTLEPAWYEQRQKAFMEVIDSVKLEKTQSSP
jgi:hypothetical protein